jgi:hypothetical protein
MMGASDARWGAKTQALFSYVSCERRVPVDLPLRKIDDALRALSPEFEELYAQDGATHPEVGRRQQIFDEIVEDW